MPPEHRTNSLSYQDMVYTYRDATRGKYSPERIECSPEVFDDILDRIYDPWMDALAARAGYGWTDRSQMQWYRDVIKGNRPLLFQGATIVKSTTIPRNEIRFINAQLPEQSRTLYLNHVKP